VVRCVNWEAISIELDIKGKTETTHTLRTYIHTYNRKQYQKKKRHTILVCMTFFN
jgi:hypothetical protein